jgi:hypothetical protein
MDGSFVVLGVVTSLVFGLGHVTGYDRAKRDTQKHLESVELQHLRAEIEHLKNGEANE